MMYILRSKGAINYLPLFLRKPDMEVGYEGN